MKNKEASSTFTIITSVTFFLSVVAGLVWLQAWLIATTWNYGLATIFEKLPSIVESQVLYVEGFFWMCVLVWKKF